MNNKSLSPLSVSLSLPEKDWEVTPLTLLSITIPPFFSLTHSLHLLHEHEPAAFSASPSAFELFWHMRSPLCFSASFFFLSFHQSHTSLHTSVSLCFPLQDRKRSGSREHQRRRLTTITGRGSGQWPVWERTVVGQLWFNTFGRWMRKPHQRRQKGKEQERLKTCWTPEEKPQPEEGKQGDKDIFG